MNYLGRVFLGLFVLLFSTDAFAGITLTLPGQVNQGGFFRVLIKEDGGTNNGFYTVSFAGKAIRTFWAEEENAHVVLIPVGVDEKVGRRELAFYQGTNEAGNVLTKGNIEVKKVNFPKSEKVFKRPPYTKSQLARLEREQALLKNIYTNWTAKQFFHNNLLFSCPLCGELSPASSEFGSIRKVKIGKDPKIYTVRHYGVDYPVSEGTRVFAAENGIVRFSGDLLGAGKTVIVDHGYGLFTVYEHLSKMIVKDGDFVLRGLALAYSGKTGNATGPNLHFGVKLHNVWVDPKYFLGGAR